MVAIKSKSIDEIFAMADQHLPVPGADVLRLIEEITNACVLTRQKAFEDIINHLESVPSFGDGEWAANHVRKLFQAEVLQGLAKADQEDPV